MFPGTARCFTTLNLISSDPDFTVGVNGILLDVGKIYTVPDSKLPPVYFSLCNQ